MAKFVSKSLNYRVILRAGQPAEPLTGRVAVPSIFAKFENGILKCDEDSDVYKMLLKHENFGSDFVLCEDVTNDPFIATRGDGEPQHQIVNVEYGHVGKSENHKPIQKMGADQIKAISEVARDMAKDMVKQMLPELLKDLTEKQTKKTTKGKKTSKNKGEVIVNTIKGEEIGLTNSDEYISNNEINVDTTSDTSSEK